MKKIPKTINYCWFGKKEKSELILKCIESWKKYCPDYEIIEWNEKNFDVTCNAYCKEAYENKKWAFVSDYARLAIIYEHGGVYLDTDVELIKNINEFLNNDSFFCCENKKLIATGLGFGAKPKNKLVKRMLDEYENIHFSDGNSIIDKTPCPIRNTIAIKKVIGDKIFDKKYEFDNNIILPKEYFCPLDYETKKLNITKNTFGIHWYNESWLSPYRKVRKKILVLIRNLIGEKKYNIIKKSLSRNTKDRGNKK